MAPEPSRADVTIGPEPADSPDAAACLRRYMAELDERFDIGFDPAAALLFVNFDTGETLQLSGTAEVDWTLAGRPGDDGHTGRRAVFTLEKLVAGHLLPSRQVADNPYPRNLPLTD